MKLSKFLMGMVIMTTLSLVYIQLQVQILDLAYQGKTREAEMQGLIDDNGNILYAISSLKSAQHLGVKMLNGDSKMQFLDDRNVVPLRTSIGSVNEDHLALSSKPEKKGNFLAGIFSLKSQAEAGFTK